MVTQTTGGFNSRGATTGVLNVKPFKSGVSPTGQSISSQGQNIPAPTGSFYSGEAHPSSTGTVKKQITINADGSRNETHFDNKVGNNPGVLKTSTPTSTPAKTQGALAPATTTYNTPPSSLSANQPEQNAPVVQPNPTVPKPDNTYSGLINRATTIADTTQGIGQNAVDTAANYGAEYARVGKEGAGLMAGQRTTGTSPVAEGNAAITAQTTAAQQSALAAGGQLAQTGLQNQLSAQNQAQSGMLSSAGLTPEALRYGGANGGTLNPLQNLDSIATQVINGQISPAQAQAMGGGISTWQGALNQAILAKNPQYNQAQAQGKYDAQEGAAGTQAGTIESYTSALQQGQNLQTQLTDLISNFGLNPTDINKANAGLQVIASNVSDPRYKILQNYVNDIANTYAQILTPPGGTATDTTRGIASSMLDSTMAGTGLITVMKSLDEAAKAKIAGVSTTGGAGTGSTKSGGFAEAW